MPKSIKESDYDAEQIQMQRQRKVAVQQLQKHRGEEQLWEAVIVFQNYSFYTFSGLPFSYVLKVGKDGNYNKELLVNRRKESKSLAWSSVVLAFKNALKLSGKIIERPKELGDIRGISYIYPMFCLFGLIEVPDGVAEKLGLKPDVITLVPHTET
jgi:hypothetical protein